MHGAGVLKAGLAVAPACTNCHGAHDIAPVKDEDSKVSRQNVTDTCGTCHEFIVARWKNEHPRRAVGQGRPQGPGVHQLPHRPQDASTRRIYGNHLKMADKCGECHKEQSESYRDSFHGKATRMGFEVAATCADCHTPHEMLPAKDPQARR